ncbi:MAG: galactitol-1-phosphate 5-dehydrogenase [Planctomycetes bacterium RBG_13_62_9]|nr:MAG: galactitol-1-phosphate 5-dehydrogenase [Planctomycetes bacterium RBG_13_62_9]
MKALVHTKPYVLEYRDHPDPQVGEDDVLVRVKACGICGSDVAGFTGKTGRRIPPIIMGHEAAGVVERTGRNVTGFAVGDRICFDSTVYCNQCPACRQGLYNRCVKRQVLGVSVPEFRRHGAFAEFVAVPHWICAKLPENMSFVQAALLEPASIGVHAANRSPMSKGSTAVVIGAGTIGLFILQAAKLRGARTIACDINDFRLDLAGRVGADACLNAGKVDLQQEIQKRTDGRGADVAFEAVGYGETFRQAVSLTKTGGHVVAVGNVQKDIEIDLQELVSRELTFTGSYASSGEFRACIGLIAEGKIDVQPLISEVLPLKEGPAAFQRLLDGKENLLKIVLEP